MDFASLQALDAAYVAQTYGRFPVGLVRGHGAECFDTEGKRYLDFTSGIGVNALGFCDAGWIDAVQAQLQTLQHTSNLYYTAPCAHAAEMLCKRTGMRKVFFANSGAESNEGAMKCARKYSFDKYGAGRDTIVALENSFHGRTVTTLSATGQDVFHRFYMPFTPGFRHAPANDWEGTLPFLTEDVCAVMLELLQGEGGVVPLTQAYVQKVAAYCQAHDVLLLIDEVQTGIGRTGTLFAFEQYGLSPDVVTSAKGLGGGLPIGAVLFGEKTEHVLGAGDHATTFGGNPVVCAGACYILQTVDEAMLASVREKGEILRNTLLAMPHVRDVTGMGMMLGVTLAGTTAAQVVREGIAQGILLLTAKQKVRLLPPLSMTKAEIMEGMDILRKILKAVA